MTGEANQLTRQGLRAARHPKTAKLPSNHLALPV